MKGIKKIHVIAVLMIVVAVVLLFSASKDLSTYATFAEAEVQPQAVKVVGVLARDKDMYYNPEEDPNYFSFFVKDINGDERKVILLDAKPQDFELSEQIVVTGKMQEGAFMASNLLMKCPSKYKDVEISVRKDI